MHGSIIGGSLVGCVRWCPKIYSSMGLYRSLLGENSTSLILHHKILESSSLETARSSLPSHSCWLPAFGIYDWKSACESIVEGNGKIINTADGVAIVIDEFGGASVVYNLTKASLNFNKSFISHNSVLPADTGDVCWLDLLTPSEKENVLAHFWAKAMNWKVGKAISFPGGKYITIMDGMGLENRHKLGGILPRVAWPQSAQDLACHWVPFFKAPSKDSVTTAASKIAEQYGSVLLPAMEADGTVVVFRDEENAIFGYYHRTDPPDVIKPDSL